MCAAEANSLQARRDFAKVSPHKGEDYLVVLQRLHAALKPKSYLEIGTLGGQSLNISRCASIAIDPKFQIRSGSFVSGKPQCHLFEMTSDDFFGEFDPKEILKRKLDISFLDGMHWCEFLLRDFINVEAHSNSNSIIAMHDCIPVDSHVARRDMDDSSKRELSEFPLDWAGDVWKVVRVLKTHRPDLKIIALDAPPTGLVLVTNLDPSSTVLKDKYFSILNTSLGQDDGFAEFISTIDIRPTSSLRETKDICQEFWL